MSTKTCTACNDLREYAPEFVQHGVTSNVCSSLRKNTGLNKNLSPQHYDCEDLNDVNDCLIGNMDDEIEDFEVCEWQDFMHQFIPNLYETNKANICAICGLWTAVGISSYVGIIQLHRTTQGLWNVDPTYQPGDSYTQHSVTPAFQTATVNGTLPSGVLTASNDKKSVIVNNTTSVPLLVKATLNLSIRTTQYIACCFATITRDNVAIGQTPFITPSTYDQQVTCEPFILNAGETTTLSYYFAVGASNNWYINQFGTRENAQPEIQCCLEQNTSNLSNQRSYFDVEVTGIAKGYARAGS